MKRRVLFIQAAITPPLTAWFTTTRNLFLLVLETRQSNVKAPADLVIGFSSAAPEFRPEIVAVILALPRDCLLGPRWLLYSSTPARSGQKELKGKGQKDTTG